MGIIIISVQMVGKLDLSLVKKEGSRRGECDLNGFVRWQNENVFCLVEITGLRSTRHYTFKGRNLLRQVGNSVDVPDGLSRHLMIVMRVQYFKINFSYARLRDPL